MFRLVEQPINRDALIESLVNKGAGAFISFEGWVRNQNEGRPVHSLEYQVYETLAQKEGAKILAEAKEKFNLLEVVCTHRSGHLVLGEIAVWIGATARHRDDAFKASRYVIDQIKFRLPIWKKEHYSTGEAVWVQCRGHETHVHFHAEDYYAKQSKVVEQAKLDASRVLVVGAGGLGSHVLTSLAMAGVREICVVDFDVVSITNLHRQPLYAVSDVGERKVKVAAKKISALNPFIKVHAEHLRIGADNVMDLISDKDLILDCTDNLETKFLLHDACLKNEIPLVSASIYQFEGQIRTYDASTNNGCMRCTMPTTPDDSTLGNCNDFGVLGASVGAIGCIQANEAVLFLTNRKNSTSSHTFFLNLLNLQQMKIKNIKQANCRYCAGDFAIEDENIEIEYEKLNSSEFELVDIRDRDESCLQDWHKSDKKIVLYCHRGVRSKKLVKEQRALGFSHFYSLRGGACSL